MAQAGNDFSTFLERHLSILPPDEAVLIPLYDAYRAAGEAMQSVFNKPRADRASDILEDDIERINDLACAVAVKLSQLRFVKHFWRDMYSETMLSHNFFVVGSPAEALETLICPL